MIAFINSYSFLNNHLLYSTSLKLRYQILYVFCKDFLTTIPSIVPSKFGKTGIRMRLQAQWNHVRFSLLSRSSLNSCLTFTASSFVGHRSTTANRPMPLDDFDIFTEEFWKPASLEGVKFVWKSGYITVPWIKIESVLWSSSSHNTCIIFDNPKKFHTKITDHETGACFLRLIIRHIGCQKYLPLFNC